MAEDSDLEKTEAPTGRRLEQAREKGQVPHSRELGTFLLLLVGSTSLWVMGGWLSERAMMLMRKGLTLDMKMLVEPDLALTRLADMSLDAIISFSPLLAILVFACLLPPFLLNAFVFSPGSISPDFGRLDPMAGIGRMFSWNGLSELVKSIVKSVLIGGMAVIVIWRQRDEMLSLLSQPLNVAIPNMGHLLTFSFFMIVMAMVLIVAIDVPFQLWQYYDKLKMTKEEVKQEMKEQMGDPMVKGRIRQLQREASRRRMMAAIPAADVIVTNPTHYAVALSYKAGMAAPKVLAKGMGLIAQKIKEIGATNGIPLLEAPPLARTLYANVEIDGDIPGGLYTAVAEVLAYVFNLNKWREIGGNIPMPPKDLFIPPDLEVPEAA
jgi:flagellar biosynthesis protein FlhB